MHVVKRKDGKDKAHDSRMVSTPRTIFHVSRSAPPVRSSMKMKGRMISAAMTVSGVIRPAPRRIN
jgi:hypothetical protein